MSVHLLDVNVLLALSWPKHTAHAVAQRWFGRNAARGWATCPFVQAGFVRILSNPAFSVHAVTPKEALEALEITTEHPGHQFWSDELGVAEAFRPSASDTRVLASVGHPSQGKVGNLRPAGGADACR